MSLLPQLTVAVLIWLVIIGTFFSPELKAYSAQLIALLLLFYIILRHIAERQLKKDLKYSKENETLALFLTTFLRPKIRDVIELCDHPHNIELIGKQLEMINHEIDEYLKEEEKEISEQ